MKIYAIFERPLDHPDHYVLRVWHIGSGFMMPEEEGTLADSLEQARQHIPAGLYRIPRQPADPQYLVESWV